MTPRTLIHTVLLVAVMAAVGFVVMDRASAAEPQIPGVSPVGDNMHTRSETLKIGKSLVLDFSRDIKDVLVADSKIANAMLLSSRRAYIIGNATGETNIIFFDAEGKQMASYEITVIDKIKINSPPSRDVSYLSKIIQKLIPGARGVNVESVGDGIVLTGTVASQLEAQQAYDIAAHFVAPNDAFNNSNSDNVSGGRAAAAAAAAYPARQTICLARSA